MGILTARKEIKRNRLIRSKKEKCEWRNGGKKISLDLREKEERVFLSPNIGKTR